MFLLALTMTFSLYNNTIREFWNKNGFTFVKLSTINEFTENEKQLKESRARLAQMQGSFNSISRGLPSLSHMHCNSKNVLLTDAQLELQIDSYTKKIEHSKVIKALELPERFKITGIYLDPESLNHDYNALNGLNIDHRQTVSIIEFPSVNGARAFDFLISIQKQEGEICYEKLRLHFAEAATELKKSGWRIVSVIGRSGLGLGRFSLPYGTQFYDGKLWTTDCSNENISTFSLDGQFLGSFGKYGTQLGQLDTPAALRIADNKIYVVEERNHRVQVFDMSGKPINVFGAHIKTNEPLLHTNKFNKPLGIAYNGKHLAVVDHGNNRIIGVDPEAGYTTEWVSGNLSQAETFEWNRPYYARWSETGGYFVVSNRSANEVVLIGPRGKKIRSLGRELLDYPHEIDVDVAGNIYVADMNNHRVVTYIAASDFRESEAQFIPFPQSFGLPKTLTILPDGLISVGFVGNGTAYFLVLAPETAGGITQMDAKPSEFATHVPVKSDQEVLTAFNGESSLEIEALNIYSTYCASCHENGDYGAPARGNIESWEKFSNSMDELLQLTIQGKGAMIPRGGCDECSDALLSETIKFMLPMNWFQEDITALQNTR